MLDLPVLATLERPVEEKGALPEKLQAVLPDGAQVFEKNALVFSSVNSDRCVCMPLPFSPTKGLGKSVRESAYPPYA